MSFIKYSTSTPKKLRTFRHSNQYIYTFILLSSLVSLVASFVLSVDAISIAKNPNSELSCNINSVISCGTVASSWQAQVFGFPNAFIGLMFEPVICALAILGLSGVRLPKKFMALVNAVYFLAFAFALWLFYESITEIHALCPYCLLVTLGTGLVFFNLLHINLRDNAFSLGERARSLSNSFLLYYGDLFAMIIYVFAIAITVLLSYGSALFS